MEETRNLLCSFISCPSSKPSLFIILYEDTEEQDTDNDKNKSVITL